MNRAFADRIAEAVLYEGYILYPYRPSIKNRHRWTFGGLYPESYCRSGRGHDASWNQTECLVHGTSATIVEAGVRFLHLTQRRVGEVIAPEPTATDSSAWPYRLVEVLRVGDDRYHDWQEAEEREVALEGSTLGELSSRPRGLDFDFPGGRRLEPVRGPDGAVVGVLDRAREAISGALEIGAAEVEEGLYRLTLRISNRTPWEGDGEAGDRDSAILRTMASTNAVLGVRGGEFVSLLDPPGRWRAAASACRNVGTWPVLVGPEGERDTMLASPIILYDYPEVAPESPGDFFDGTEIDEMLALRIVTLTDEEKGAMAGLDARGRALLERTEAMARDEWLGLHGTIRGLRATSGEGADG